MKKFAMIMITLLAGTALLNAQEAVSIMNAARNRIKADTISTRSRMVITAKNGSTTERLIDQYSKDDSKGNARAVIVFQRPANVAGTRFLTMDNSGGGSDRWIYLPSLGKVRRIAASESGGSFMGTDFSYDDISSTDRDLNLDTHTLLREEPVNGVTCYVIESVPKESNYQYSKTITWIDKNNSLIYKSEMYDRRGTLVKVMEMSDFKDVQGRLTPLQIKISTLAAGTSTTIYMDITKYDDPIPEAVFTTAYLETGRAR
ncbi:MAG: outer membrane lipoprotein-sorting protein [Spirochaetaceae bacterium]|jgi:outer membrane lipoprotein-sorting protein|nr:outer membrane lipoprotein-sorting protein [Spirochaetaceae bacterium]